MNSLTTLKVFTQNKRIQLNLSDLESILNLLPDAAFLVEMRNQTILLANRKAIEFFAYARTELIGMDVDILLDRSTSGSSFVTQSFRELFPEDGNINFIKRSGISAEVHCSCHILDHNGKWQLVTFEPIISKTQRLLDQKRQEYLWEDFHILIKAVQETDLNTGLSLLLQVTSKLTGADCLGIYQASPENPLLQRTVIWGNPGNLPELITSREFFHLQTPQIWLRGKRPQINLHRHARTSALQSLASAPIGDGNAAIGLLVAASGLIPLPETILPIIEALAASIATIIQIHAQLASLKANLQEQSALLNINSIVTLSVQDSVVTLNPDLTIMGMNQSAERSLGYTQVEVRGQPIEHVLIGSENTLSILASLRENPHPYTAGNINLFRRNGVSFLANLRIEPVIDEENLTGFIILFNDLSEREQYRLLNQQLEQRALLGEVTASFAHEVRNPINNISTGLQVLAHTFAEDDPNQDQIKRLQQDCDRLAELVKSSLSFVRPMEYKLEPVDVGGILQRLVDRWHSRLERAKIQSHVSVDEKIPPVEGDFRALEQVFTNLINNAIQAMEMDGGVLAIKVRRLSQPEDHEQVEISISDTGPGIPAEVRERIFEPFFTTKTNGTGLGLAIVKRIVTAHKGAIYVSSIPGGTIFQVLLPAIQKR